MMDWQPMNTAPVEENETVLLSCLDEDGERYCVAGFWDMYDEYPDGAWFLYPTNGNQLVIGVPTHWMPLPAPPA